MVGRTILHYRIVEKIGEGGMGVVYKAHDLKLDRSVALKILPVDRTADPDRKGRFIHEARTASALNHPNIVTIHDIEESEGTSFIVMEYVSGKTLDQRIGRSGLRVSDTLKYAVQIAGAMAKAHAAGIVHRDLKPSNIIVSDDGVVKILDFGLAKLKEAPAGNEFAPTAIDQTGRPVTEEGAIVGTVAYMSPEQAEAKTVDSRSDIFSFGSVLYEMLTGRKAFECDSKISTLSAILSREPAPLSPDIPRDIEKIVVRCLRKDPERRFQHAEDLKVALEELKEESDSGRLTSGIAPSLPYALSRWRSTTLLAIAASLIVLLGATAVVTWLLFRPPPAGRSPKVETGTSRLHLLLSSETGASNPCISPDGKMIVYVAAEQGREDLFVTRVAGGARVRLTNDEALETTPEFSPDGERILFTRFAPESRLPEIWMVPTLGGQATRVVSQALDGAWSPDGRRLAFVSRRPGAGDVLATCETNGGDFRPLMRSDGNYPFFRHPRWDPDGSRLAVVRSTGGVAGELWLVPITGGTPHRLWVDPPGVFSNAPVFTADGREIVHQSNRAGATNLWSLPVRGGPPLRLTNGTGPDESPTVARNGLIAFLNARSRCGLIVCDLKTGQRREVLSHSGYVWGPAFSPRADELAVCLYERDGLWHIWIVPVSGGGAPRQLTSGALPEMYPRFAPDGKSVFYHTWSPGPDRIWRVSLAGGPPVPVTPARDEDDAYADISPDGKWIAFARSEKEITRVYLAPSGGGEARRLTDQPSTVPRWSPDGRRIVFSASRGYNGGVFLVGTDGSGLRCLSETGSWPLWWPGGDRVAYMDLGPDGNQQILQLPAAGGAAKPLRIDPFRGANKTFDISADGTLLSTMDCTDLSSEIWLMEPMP